MLATCGDRRRPGRATEGSSSPAQLLGAAPCAPKRGLGHRSPPACHTPIPPRPAIALWQALDFVLETSSSLASLVLSAREEERLLGPPPPHEEDDDLAEQLLVAQELAAAAVGVLRRYLPEPTGGRLL